MVNEDVVILGGGPAGAFAAIQLSRMGIGVHVLERSLYSRPRIGETLPPTATPLLQRAGVLDNFRNDRHASCPGIVAAWLSDHPHENDFIFSPYGDGWHLDRTRFDRTLADTAEQQGVNVTRAARVQSCIRGSNGWIVQFQVNGQIREIAAKFLIDATGRAAWLARKQGARRIVFDWLVGVIGFGFVTKGEDRRTYLEATPDGWWYSARLPDGRVVAAYMTDSDLLPRGHDNLKCFWLEHLRNARLTYSVWTDPHGVDELTVKRAGTVRLDRNAGPGWMAIGDAAVALDPLSSQGILKAMESGFRAAEIVAEILVGKPSAAASYSAWMESEFATYARSYSYYYNQVRRWPDSAFWQRRFSTV